MRPGWPLLDSRDQGRAHLFRKGCEFEVSGPEFRVGKGPSHRPQMFGAGFGKRFGFCRFSGNGRQGRHFHREFLDGKARRSAGMGEDCVLMKTQFRRPGRGARQKDDPPGLHGRQTALAAQGIRQRLAQLTIERIQGARPRKQGGDGGRFADGQGGKPCLRGWCGGRSSSAGRRSIGWLHGMNPARAAKCRARQL